MDVMDAAKAAARYVSELESLMSPGQENEQILRDIRFAVEGTRYDGHNKRWSIDVGFARPWDQATSSPLAGLAGSMKDNRTFKTVTIDDATGKVLDYGASR